MSAISGFVRTSDHYIWRTVENFSYRHPLLGRVASFPLVAYTLVRDVAEAPLEGIEEMGKALWKGDSENVLYAFEDAIYFTFSPVVALADASSTLVQVILSPTKTARINADHQGFKECYDEITKKSMGFEFKGSKLDFKYSELACYRDMKAHIAWGRWKAYKMHIYTLTEEEVRAFPSFEEPDTKSSFIEEVNTRFRKYEQVNQIHIRDFAGKNAILEVFKKKIIHTPLNELNLIQCPFEMQICQCISNPSP